MHLDTYHKIVLGCACVGVLLIWVLYFYQRKPKTVHLVFEVGFDKDDFVARAIGEAIFTQGRTMKELKQNIVEAVLCHFDKEDLPAVIHVTFDDLSFNDTHEENFILTSDYQYV